MPTPTRNSIEASFGYHLREKRIERNLTPDQLAEQLRIVALEKTEEYKKYESKKESLEMLADQLREDLLLLSEARTVDTLTIVEWEHGTEVPNHKEVEILASLLFGEKEVEKKRIFITLADKARSQEMYDRISDKRNNSEHSFAAILKDRLGGMDSIAIEEINNARKEESIRVSTRLNKHLQDTKETIADLEKIMREKPEFYLVDGSETRYRVVLSQDEAKSATDIEISDAIYFMEAGMLPSKNLYNLIISGLDKTRQLLAEDKAELQSRYEREMLSIGHPDEHLFVAADHDRKLTSWDFVENSKELEEYARLHAELFHTLGYPAQQRAKNSDVEGIVVTTIHPKVASEIGRSNASMPELTPFCFRYTVGRDVMEGYLSEDDINNIADKSLPKGQDKDKFKDLCRRYNEAKRKLELVMRADRDGSNKDTAIPEARKFTESVLKLEEEFRNLGISNIVSYSENPILSDWSYNKMIEGSFAARRAFTNYFGRLKTKIDRDENVKKHKDFTERYNNVTGNFMIDFYAYEAIRSKFEERFSKIVGELNLKLEQQTGHDSKILAQHQLSVPTATVSPEIDGHDENKSPSIEMPPVVPPAVAASSISLKSQEPNPPLDKPKSNVVEKKHIPYGKIAGLNGKSPGIAKRAGTRTRTIDDIVKEYAAVLSGIYLLEGVEPPRLQDSSTDIIYYYNLAQEIGVKQDSSYELVPFNFKRMDSTTKQKLLANVKTDEEKETLRILLDLFDEIAPELEKIINNIPEKQKLNNAGNNMLGVFNGDIKAICVNNGDFAVNSRPAARKLLNGDLDLGDKLTTYLKHISPSYNRAFLNARKNGKSRFTNVPKQLEPELAEFGDSCNAYHIVRRRLISVFNSVANESCEITGNLNGQTKGINGKFAAIISWLQGCGAIDIDNLKHLSHTSRVNIASIRQNEHEVNSSPPL